MSNIFTSDDTNLRNPAVAPDPVYLTASACCDGIAAAGTVGDDTRL
jgi:hypothetical protein